jgi:hypothetical protein
MQEFFIKKDSVNPVLEMELIYDGRYDFQKSLINYALQDSVITFSMINEETGILKVSKAKANIVRVDEDSCEERYVLQYKWKPRDVNTVGFYQGFFEIQFNGDLTANDTNFPTGNLKVPVEEDLRIVIK